MSPNSNGSASLLKPTLHKVYHPEVKFDGEEIVDVKKYDNLEIKNINFMSIDVQGYELNVLKGAEKSLNKIDYLIVEINRKELYKNSTILKDLDYFLYMKGFDRQITVFWDKYCTWGDAFYIKSNLLTRKLRIKSAVKNSFFKFRILYNLSTFFRKILSLR